MPEQVDLIEAHGVDVFDASLVQTADIAFPNARARDLTPQTVPASVTSGADAMAPWITEIVCDSDGSVSFTLGVHRRVSQRAPISGSAESPPFDLTVFRDDPITGERVEFAAGAGSLELPPSPFDSTDSTGARRR